MYQYDLFETPIDRLQKMVDDLETSQSKVRRNVFAQLDEVKKQNDWLFERLSDLTLTILNNSTIK